MSSTSAECSHHATLAKIFPVRENNKRKNSYCCGGGCGCNGGGGRQKVLAPRRVGGFARGSKSQGSGPVFVSLHQLKGSLVLLI